MTEAMPAVSVVMPVRDGAAFLKSAISSVLMQSFSRFELIIVDDGSTDDSAAIAGAETDRRVRVFSQPATGISAALNNGIATATGQYIARMDADDVAAPERLAKQVSVLRANSRISAVGSGYLVIDTHGRRLHEVSPPTEPDDIRRQLLTRNCMAHPTMMIRRDALLDVGGYRAGFPLCEDYDLWLRLSEISDLCNIGEPLLAYRRHDRQISSRNLEQRIISEIAVLRHAARRRDGLHELPEPPGQNGLLVAGMTNAEIRNSVRRRALMAARGAIGECAPAAARAALGVALRQGMMSPVDAARCVRLALLTRRLTRTTAGHAG
jgi:Glycosyl transferase family 2